MRCPFDTREGSELLVAYSARKLDARTAAALNEHIRTCPACLKAAGEQDNVWRALDAWEAAPVSNDFDRRVHARIENEVSWWQKMSRPLRALTVARGAMAATAGLILLAALLLQPTVTAPVGLPTETAQLEAVGPDQAENALLEMDTIREFSDLIPAGGGGPGM